jgi:hypothetical protein
MQRSTLILVSCMLLVMIWILTQNPWMWVGCCILLIYAAHERYKEYAIPVIR